jgi:fructose-bisphosphate aldolase, class I
MSCQPRLNRLFAPDGKCFDVAIDHGFFNEKSFLGGIESLPKAIQTVIEANPDAIQLPPGGARILQAIPGRAKPSLVLRTDIANVYGSQLPSKLISVMIEKAVEQAVRLDASCVVVNLLQLPNQPELYESCIQNICGLKPQCDAAGMPLMIEPLVMQDNAKAGGYMVDGDIDKIMPLVRQAMELGADIIKADPTDNVEDYHKVIEVASGTPVLVRGGGRATDQDILVRTEKLMQQGASGIVYGRNVIQHPNPSGMTKALMAIVHNGASATDAINFL